MSAVPLVVWGYLALTVIFLVIWFITYWRLSQRRDNAVALAIRVLAHGVLLRLASVAYYAEHKESLRQVFGVSDWVLDLALQQLLDQRRVHEGYDGNGRWVQLSPVQQGEPSA